MLRAAPCFALALLALLAAPATGRAALEEALAAHPDSEQLRALWQEGLALERAHDDLDGAAARFEELARALPEEAEPLWRLARLEWRRAERLPADQKKERLAGFRFAEQRARASLARDARC